MNGDVYINFDVPYPKQAFYAFVPASRAGSIDQVVTLQGLEIEVVKVAGEISDYKGRLQIVVTEASQISI